MIIRQHLNTETANLSVRHFRLHVYSYDIHLSTIHTVDKIVQFSEKVSREKETNNVTCEVFGQARPDN